jgi:hypothetical protein
MVSIAYYMTPEILNNYIENLDVSLSSIIYDKSKDEDKECEKGEEGPNGDGVGEDGEKKCTVKEKVEERRRNRRRELRNYGKLRPMIEEPYEIYDQKENLRNESDSLKFRVRYISTEGSSIWLSL